MIMFFFYKAYFYNLYIYIYKSRPRGANAPQNVERNKEQETILILDTDNCPRKNRSDNFFCIK